MKIPSLAGGISLAFLLTIVGCHNSDESEYIPVDPQDGIIAFEVLKVFNKPLIGKNSPGTEDNKYGFEGGRIQRVNDTLHLTTAEMIGDPFNVNMRLGHWQSVNGLSWERMSTIYQSSADFTGTDTRAALWSPMPVFDRKQNRWNLFYVSYRADASSRNYDGRVWQASSMEGGLQGIGGPYSRGVVILEPGTDSDAWEGLQGVDSFFPFDVGGEWLAFYGSAQTQNNPPTSWEVGLARSTTLQGPWERLSASNPLTLGTNFIENPVVQRLDNGLFLFFFDGGPDRGNFGYSYSWDGVHWSKAYYVPTSDSDQRWWGLMRTPLCLLKNNDGTYTIYFTAYSNAKKDDNFEGLGRVDLKLIDRTK